MALGARKEFPESVKVATYAEQNGKCLECCEFTRRADGVFDHIIRDAMGGSNTRDNCRFLCRGCDHFNTYGHPAVPLSSDKAKVEKMKRQIEATNEHFDVMADKGCAEPAPLKGTIPGRSFAEGHRPMAEKKELPKKLREPLPPLPRPSMYRDLTPDEIRARDGVSPKPAAKIEAKTAKKSKGARS